MHPLEPLHPETFAPFGDVIEAADPSSIPADSTTEAVNAGTSQRRELIPALDLLREDARAVLALYEARAQQLPFEAREVERHQLSDQVFLPLGRALRCVVLVAPADAEPSPQTLRAFVSNGRQGVRIRAGTWHHGLLSLDAGPWVVLERRALDGTVDCDVRVLAPALVLQAGAPARVSA